MSKKLAFIFTLLCCALLSFAQIQVKSERDTSTNLKIKTINVPSGNVIIVYPIPKGFSQNIYANIDFGEEQEYMFSRTSYLSETYEKKKKKKTKIKARKMVFYSEADLLNYLLKRGFEFVGGPNTSFILRRTTS